MMTDPIVEEVRAARARIAQECGYDLGRILDHARLTAGAIPGLRYVTAEQWRARRKATPSQRSPNPSNDGIP
jgi:hypothetical protein